MSSNKGIDRRMDPRVRELLASLGDTPLLYQSSNVSSREEALAIANSAQALRAEAAMEAMLEAMDDPAVAPTEGLRISTEIIPSQPDGNSIKLQIIRPDTDETLPCLYYIHGGAMMTMSCFHGNYRAWGRLLAHQGLCVVMVDFRNSLRPSSAPEVAPFPAGLNDCVSGVHWVRANAQALCVEPTSIVLCGESGGGNLAIATTMKLVRDGHGHFIKGLYALCPYILGAWPSAEYPSTIENADLLISVSNNHATMAYGMDAYEQRNPLAWPSFADLEDVAGFPPTMISINECDPLRDEGIAFYRLLLEAGVHSHCRQLMGTVHANELLSAAFPDFSRMTARDIRGWVDECLLHSP